MNSTFKQIYSEIKKFDTIYISRHISPDPDAIASQNALRDAIKLTFPEKKVYSIGATVARFKYLGKLDKVERFDYEDSLLICLDTPNKVRIDGTDVNRFKNIIKIDHHPFIENFSNIEYVDDSACSTCQIIFELLENTRLKCNTDISGLLFIGIISDSNRFLFDYTSVKTFEIVSVMLSKYKINMQGLYSKLYERPLSEVRLLGYISSNMKVTKNKFAYIELENDILKSFGADTANASNMASEFGNIREVLVWAIVSYDELNKIYKVNIRSRGPIINEIASKFGGGGHAYASGVRTPNHEVIDELLHSLDECSKEYIKNNKTVD